jgi:hypothetical protein
MKIKSQTFTQASGSIGGLTAARNRGGMYLRARSTTVQPVTPAQLAVRNSVKTITASWSNTLTAVQRAAWTLYAANTPVVDTLGNSIVLTGINMLVRGNTPRMQAGFAQVLDGPTTFGLPTFTPVTATVTASSSHLSLTFTAGDDWANEDGGYMLTYVSRPQSPGISFFKGPYQLTGAVAGNSVTPPTSPAVQTIPFPVVTGNHVWVRVQVARADGRLSSDQVLALTAI